jgi:IS5 family transposase
MAGLAILKHTYNLSDEALCERWIENPYYQYLCGMEFFHHTLPFDRSSLSRWRSRMGEERLTALLQESLAIATRTEAMKPSDLADVVFDTTVQPKNVTFPTDAKLLHRAREKLVKLTKQLGVQLRQTYSRVGKIALIQHQRYAHAKQFKRAKRALRKLKTQLGRVIRDITRKIEGRPDLETQFASLLSLARRVREQERGQRGPKIYSLHAPEVECIGKGKPHKPYEFGVKVSITTTVKHSKGGQFIAHAQALPGNPYDGHTLATVIPATEKLIGNSLKRILTDAGYRGHNAPDTHRFKVFTAKQKRGVTDKIKRMMKRRSAVEPVIGHTKHEHRMDRNYLAHRAGDANNAVLAAAGYNFSLLLRWLKLLLCLFLAALFAPPKCRAA